MRVSGRPSSVGSTGPISSTALLVLASSASANLLFFLLGLDKSGMSDGTEIKCTSDDEQSWY